MTNENEQNLPETEDLVRELSALLGENPDAPRSEPAFDIEESQWEQLPWEEAAPPPPKKKTNIKKILYYGLLGVFISIFLISGIYLISYLVQSKEQGAQYDDLAARVESIRQEQAQNSSNSATGDPNNPIDPEYTGPYADILPEYRDVYAENKDTVGWIRIEGTKINYPVMHTPDRKDYYLKRNFKKEYSNWGAIYVRESCDVFTPSDNVTIYGHYMQDGSMFHDLHGYYNWTFYKDHQYIQFDTIYERHTYQIVAVFKTSANMGEGFAYHMFDYASSEEEFNAFIDAVEENSFYRTGVKAEYGDMLITLSTCEYTLDNGRLVVVAKRIS